MKPTCTICHKTAVARTDDFNFYYCAEHLDMAIEFREADRSIAPEFHSGRPAFIAIDDDGTEMGTITGPAIRDVEVPDLAIHETMFPVEAKDTLYESTPTLAETSTWTVEGWKSFFSEEVHPFFGRPGGGTRLIFALEHVLLPALKDDQQGAKDYWRWCEEQDR